MTIFQHSVGLLDSEEINILVALADAVGPCERIDDICGHVLVKHGVVTFSVTTSLSTCILTDFLEEGLIRPADHRL